jgi:hypothetical protein
MPFGCIAALVAALAMVTGCAPAGAGAGAADPAAARPAHLYPWFHAGPSPTASSIEYALYQDAHEIDLEECPFYLLSCTWNSPGQPGARLQVDDARCSPAGPFNDRCTFRLTETVAGREAVRSRCEGRFETVGTSEQPARWGVDYGHGETDPPPAIICRSGRVERRAVW